MAKRKSRGFTANIMAGSARGSLGDNRAARALEAITQPLLPLGPAGLERRKKRAARKAHKGMGVSLRGSRRGI
jgi:hypothetical protein